MTPSTQANFHYARKRPLTFTRLQAGNDGRTQQYLATSSNPDPKSHHQATGNSRGNSPRGSKSEREADMMTWRETDIREMKGTDSMADCLHVCELKGDDIQGAMPTLQASLEVFDNTIKDRQPDLEIDIGGADRRTSLFDLTRHCCTSTKRCETAASRPWPR
ncbi:hypothetical protein SNOG_04876 [Parastagonospora nodorum SN15]|uniref:Uncharacterized protein n=1 Tax=Phaeosphaeria nodorum (strain SN15 / ATCC MYA-4574 / FGSC 10173) TaxID=321614 RepID=Q0UTN8_PHANO|nr:hypothetical protein SNOG_04876 [Parastagonospora nodorum SN15]EAT87267.1 hypothetical protein SNOG_04876 [Parastagonospora nodorum SN15]